MIVDLMDAPLWLGMTVFCVGFVGLSCLPSPGSSPATPREINAQAQTLQSFEAFVGQRRERVEVTDLGLPSILWTVLWVGALLNAILLSLIQVRNLRIHLIMAGLIAVFVALLLYAIAGFDRPYSGPISVTPAYYQSLLDGLFQRVP